MNSNHTALFTALTLALGLVVAAEPALAVKPVASNANSASKGYPNGRPWQAMKIDFLAVKRMLGNIDSELDGLTGETDLIHDEIGLISEDINALAEDVAAQNNALDVQVSVAPSAERNADNDAPVTVFVHVTQNGLAVTDLTAEDFSYSNAFPLAGAQYCGAVCFSAGDAGVYAITLNGDWSASSYAGALAVANTVTTADGNAVTSNGSSLVTFDIPAAPLAP